MIQRSLRRVSDSLGTTFPRGSILTGGSLAVSVALNATSGLLTARLLGPTGKGVLALALVWVALASTVADLGVHQAVTYYASRLPTDRRETWGQSIFLAGAQTIVILPLALWASALMVNSADGRVAVAVALTSLPLALLLGDQLNLLRGCERFREYSAVRVGQAAAWTVVVLAFFLLDVASAIGLLIGFIVVTAVATGASGFVLFRVIGPPHLSIRGSSRLLRYGVLVWVAGIGSHMNLRIDQILLGGAVGVAVLGQYATAVNLASLLTIASTGIAIVTLPAIARAGREAGADIGRKNLAVAAISMVGAAAILGLAAPTMITGLLGSSFRPAVPLFRVLLLGQIALGSTQILHEVARGQGRLRIPAAVETTGAILTIGLLLLVIPKWGALGAAWVSVGVYSVVAVTLYLILLRRPQYDTPGGESPAHVSQEDRNVYPEPT